MRSRSSTISSTSSCASIKNAKQNADFATDSIEKVILSEFVLKMYHDCLILNNGQIDKTTVRKEFYAFDKVQQHKGYFCKKNIGTLLRKHNYLINTERGSRFYCIKLRTMFMYRNEKLKDLDESRIIGNVPASINTMSLADNAAVIEENIEISPDAEEFPVVFKGGFEQSIDPDFCVTLSGCYICQKNFNMQSDFEEHVEFHGFESDFEFLLGPGKRCSNIFVMFYRLVNKSHNFYFTMKTDQRDIIIEKIILIKTNMMHYIKTNLLPYEIPSDGIDSFLIDSHLFTIGAEQPIVVVYRNKSDKTTRFVEQHHFLRTEDFPQVYFNTRSCRIPSNSVLKSKFKLHEYDNELKAMKLLKERNFSKEAVCSLSPDLRDFITNNQLNEKNSYNVLKALNQIEDVCAQSGYSQLSQEGIKLKRFGQEYSVKLKKLSKDIFLENILSPLDEIYLVASEDTSILHSANAIKHQGRTQKKPKVYRAIIERVYYDTVCFRYEGRPICDRGTYNATFKPSRLGLRYQYRALDILQNNTALRKYLHPSQMNFQTAVSTGDFELFNPSIKSNTEQLQAVQNIVDGPTSFAPYIIFGPPGTGKTSTVVEAVLQLWKQRPDTRILIAAGSNAACDEVAIRLCRTLINLQPGEPNILRIFARSNEKRLDSIDELLLECSNFYRSHFYPSVDVIKQFRIVVCTLSVVGKLVTGGIGNDFFTHVFIDECAASTEPESLVGITGTFSMKTRLILSGDHKQLGPVLKSSVANDLGLKVSLMERLLNLDCYSVSSNGDYDRSIQSRLVQNFRSHSKIVELFNTLYYGCNLKAMADDETVNLCANWCRMPNKEYPIVFHAVYGSNRRTGRSVSLSNEREIEVVMDYVKDLMYFGMNGREIFETDIGIISPYKKQYTRIQEELNRRQWFQIEVGAVETFQGKEKPIIIVSNVRSFTKTLGFLDNPRRINVILSRAQSLLIMIGNPNTLSQCEDLKYIISQCRLNKSAVGSFRDIIRQEEEEKGQDKSVETASIDLMNVIKKTGSIALAEKNSSVYKSVRGESNRYANEKNGKDLLTLTNTLRKEDFYEKKTGDISIVVQGRTNLEQNRNGLRKEDFYENTAYRYNDFSKIQNASRLRLVEKQTVLRKEDFYEKTTARTSNACKMQDNVNRLKVVENNLSQPFIKKPTSVESIKVNTLNNARHFRSEDTETFDKRLEDIINKQLGANQRTASSSSYQYPRKQPAPMPHVYSNSGIDSTRPRNSDSSAFSFPRNDNYKYYEKVVPLSTPKPRKESKCVLC